MLNLREDDSTQHPGDEWSCPACSHANDLANRYCGSCGKPRTPVESDSVPPKNTAGMEATSAIAVTLIALFLGGLLLMAVSLFGGRILSVGSDAYAKLSSTPRPETSPFPSATIQAPTNVAPYVTSSPYLEPAPPIALPTFEMPDTSGFDTPYGQAAEPSTATVISENANLRASPSTTGEVITMIPQGSSVIILRQTGPWFRVAFGSSKGWLHGNTIEFDLEVSPTPY